jgi:Protein of unknown function (DUF3551)
MKNLTAAGLVQFALFAAVGHVQAVEYPWCRTEGGGSRSCYYANKKQCAAQGRGFGGTCIENPFYQKLPERAPVERSHVKRVPRH